MTDLDQQSDTPHRPRQRSRRRASERGTARVREPASTLGSGGRLSPLSRSDMQQIHEAVLNILSTVGFSDVSVPALERVVAAGGEISDNHRLCFPKELVESALHGLRRDITLCGQHPEVDLMLTGKRVYVGTGGASPAVADIHTGEYRDSTLQDVYDAARLADALDNVHFYSRSVVARDMPNSLALDVNTAYASLSGTRKHVMVSATDSKSVEAIANMCWLIAGSRERFTERPFLSLNINHAVSPMRFSEEAIDVLMTAAALDIPVHTNTFSQLGASSPVTIAGCIAQTMAETLAGMVVAWVVNPRVSAICGPRPMVTDLRTGAISGGSGEQALLTAGVVQMAQFYDLPNSTIAGATDSKISDAQSGYEKCLSVTLAAHTGSNLITQACGVQAGLMACSFESFVVDNEMLGAILRTLTPVEVSANTLNIDQIIQAVSGEGHFLGHQETLERMQTDFLYPDIADRQPYEMWAANGANDIRTVANQRAQQLLQDHYPTHLSAAIDKRLRAEFDIQLPAHKTRAT